MTDEQMATDVTDEEINKAADELAAESEPEELSEEDLINQEKVKADLAYGKALVEIEEKRARAYQRADSKRSGVEPSEGYGIKMWGGHVIYQCHYCPLDVPEFDEQRMLDHMRIAHPEPRGEATYDDLGNYVGD